MTEDQKQILRDAARTGQLGTPAIAAAITTTHQPTAERVFRRKRREQSTAGNRAKK